MEMKISIFRRIIYIFFGIAGVLAMIKTGFWHNNIIGTIFHSTVLIASANWGVLGVTGKDIV